MGQAGDKWRTVVKHKIITALALLDRLFENIIILPKFDYSLLHLAEILALLWFCHSDN